MLSKKILIGTANFGKEYGLKKKKIKVNELKKNCKIFKFTRD